MGRIVVRLTDEELLPFATDDRAVVRKYVDPPTLPKRGRRLRN